MTAPERVAVVGMACRLAGDVDTPAKFWSLLSEGRDAIGEVSPDRWEWYSSIDHENARALAGVTRHGAFLDDIKGFDADFFDVTPREATLMDPQQRITLELAWEALEHAGLPPRGLAGGETGVFMGVGSDDYGRRMLEDLPRIEAWSGIGGAYCGVANRVSYSLDLRGPSIAVDTACSSSLVAINMAVQSLLAGECPVALAGGVLVMASPGLSLVLDAAGATAPDGRCKSFDASGDGYGRGEGGGIVVLKRLSDAQRDGDHVLAVIRGGAVHQDGRTSGIMAPNGEAQARLLRKAYERAGLEPATVDYVEAHGTGTRAGDPLEAGAMASVFSQDRPETRPCLIGSVKPNVGHLEAGAGIIGVIKTVLALQHAEIPPSLNFHEPNPAIPWETSGLRVVTERTPWPETDGPRRAGVSGYGYGGTLAHVILEEAPEVPTDTAPDAGLAVYPLSGASHAAVREYAGRLADRLDDRVSTSRVGSTLALRRSHLPHRGTVVAADRAQLTARLREFDETGTAPGVRTGSVLPSAGRGLVWVFSGHGSQWIGMARGLLGVEPEFTEVIDRLEPLFQEEMGVSPTAALLDDTPQPVEVVQPLIFAVQAALSALWRARGLRPDAVIGHSVGEIAAATTSRMLTLEQGARLVCRRSLLLRQVAGRGAMAMVGLSSEEAESRLGDRSDVTVAITPSPIATVISGDVPAVEEITEQWRADGVVVRRIDSDVAFHSRHMDPLLDPLAAAVSDLNPSSAELPVYSTALEDPRGEALRDGRYWATNLGGRVRFAQAVHAAVEDGYRLFLEVSPHPVVEHSINETLDHLGVEDAFTTHSLRRRQPENETLFANLGQLHCHGAEVDWSRSWADAPPIDLPPVAWQRKPYWLEERRVRPAAFERHSVDDHNLLGGRDTVSGTTPAQVWRTRLDRDTRPYPGTHPVREVEIVPAAVLLNTFLTAAGTGGVLPDLTDVSLRVPVSLSQPRDVQVVSQDGAIRLSSRLVQEPGDDKGLTTHTTANIETPGTLGQAAPVDVPEELPTEHVVDRLADLGVADMGFPWRITRLRRGEDTLEALVDTGPEPGTPPTTWASVLDAALSTASVIFPGEPALRMPAHIARVTLEGHSPADARVTVRLVGEDTVDVEIGRADGSLVGRLTGLRYGLLEDDSGTAASPRRLVHRVEWRPLEASTPDTHRAVVLLGDDQDLLRRLSRRLVKDSVPHRIASVPEELREGELSGDHTVVVVPAPVRPGEPVDKASMRATWLLIRTAQRMAAASTTHPARLWCVTQGVRESSDEAALGHAPLWGLGRIIAGEHPDLWGGLVDLGTSPLDLVGLTDLLGKVHGEDLVSVREGRPEVPRLAYLDAEPTRTPTHCHPDGTYLVTGGLGALGLEVARWLADRGARRLVLAGRRALPPRDQWDGVTDPRILAQVEGVRSIERLGATVVTVALDISEADNAEKLLSPAALGMPPIRGVVHAAGVLDSRPLRELDEDSLRTVLRPKTEGGWVLHRLFPPGSLDFFVLFSSSGHLMGLPGQSSYAAGNTFLDALASHRRAAGDSGTISFGWTSWRGLGMSTSSEVIDAELAAAGTADVTVSEAFSAWELAERHELDYTAVLRTLPLEPGQRRPAILEELPSDSPGDAPEEESEIPWAGLSGDELREFLVAGVTHQVAEETRLSVAEVDPHRALSDMGLDSVMTVRIRRGLERRFRLPLPATLFWDRPTVHAVSDLLVQRLDESETALTDEESAR